MKMLIELYLNLLADTTEFKFSNNFLGKKIIGNCNLLTIRHRQQTRYDDPDPTNSCMGSTIMLSVFIYVGLLGNCYKQYKQVSQVEIDRNDALIYFFSCLQTKGPKMKVSARFTQCKTVGRKYLGKKCLRHKSSRSENINFLFKKGTAIQRYCK